MTNTGARKKAPLTGGIAIGGTSDYNLKKLCDTAKDISIAAIRGAQVTINLEDDFQLPDMDIHQQKHVIPVFVRSNQVSLRHKIRMNSPKSKCYNITDLNDS